MPTLLPMLLVAMLALFSSIGLVVVRALAYRRRFGFVLFAIGSLPGVFIALFGAGIACEALPWFHLWMVGMSGLAGGTLSGIATLKCFPKRLASLTRHLCPRDSPGGAKLRSRDEQDSVGVARHDGRRWRGIAQSR